MLSIKTPNELAKELAIRFKQRRLYYGWSREELASRSGVTAASIKRFELTGAISLHRLLTLSFILHVLDDFNSILQIKPPVSIQELKKTTKTRQRGRKRLHEKDIS